MDLEKTNELDKDRPRRESVISSNDTPETLSENPSRRNENEDEKNVAYKKEAGPPAVSPTNTPPQALEKKMIRFEDGDPDNPVNWSRPRKLTCYFAGIMTVMNSTISSSLSSGVAQQLTARFGLTGRSQIVLPTSIYLVGYVVGPVLFGPLSEAYGRRLIMIFAFALFTIFSMATALAPNWPALLVFRFFVGVFGSCPIAVVGGLCADIYPDPETRGRAMAIFMVATVFGPLVGPIASGYSAEISWRWPYWIGLLCTLTAWPLVVFMQESFAPIILKRRAARLRRETGDQTITAPIELEKRELRHIITIVLTRPIRMICFESIVLFSSLYLALAYAIFYIFFQSYPIIYQDLYGFEAGQMGLMFLPIGVGAIISSPIYLGWDSILRKATRRNAVWAQSEEMRRLPIACIAGPFLVISLFWAGWTARPSVHWIVPALSGIPFGIGYLLIFMALLNYMVDAYEVFAASAMAASSMSRSLLGALLPFATRPMYSRLGIAWACSLLGFISLAMCLIPFVFVKYGDRIRARSPFCQYLRQKTLDERADEREDGSA